MRFRVKTALIAGVMLAGFTMLPAARAKADNGVQITAPANGQTVTGTVAVSVSVPAGVQWVDFYVDNNYASSSPPYTYNWNSASTNGGRHTLSVNAYGAGKVLIGSDLVSITVGSASTAATSSTGSGLVQITSPANGASVSGTVAISANVTSPVDWLNVYVDGNYLTSSPPYSFSWDTSAVGNGTHTVTIRGYDLANNNIASDSVNVTVGGSTASSSSSTAVTPSAGGSGSGGTPGSAGTGVFVTLPPGSALPSDQDCASQVVSSSWEPRPDNDGANQTVPTADQLAAMRNAGNYGGAPASYFARVTGNFTGTTDEILQWGACKWGFDVNVVRAIAADESWWHQSAAGDDGVTYGIMQIKSTDYPDTAPMSLNSTAFNVDWKLAYQRACFDGTISYLQGSNGYPNGDAGNMLWGCVGQWYSGQWYDSGAQQYISDVKNYDNNKVWQQPGF
jgi:hypothetical protein